MHLKGDGNFQPSEEVKELKWMKPNGCNKIIRLQVREGIAL